MGYNDDGAENGSNIYEAEVCTQELEWSGFLGGGGGGGGYHCGGGSRWAYILAGALDKEGFSVFVDLI